MSAVLRANALDDPAWQATGGLARNLNKLCAQLRRRRVYIYATSFV